MFLVGIKRMCGKRNFMNKNEKITIAWCDSGRVEGTFAAGIHFAITGTDIADQFTDIIRSKGIKIATQRQEVFDIWMLSDFDECDWLLWLDSDIEISYNVLKSVLMSSEYDYSGNRLLYLNDEKPKTVDALQSDVNEYAIQEKNVFIIGSISMAILVLGSIMFLRN
jgi:hypothetical protein